ncbi:hypothetical protein [Microvirga massiliensis]|uniref:hypothetical protein n=1 Tax=Microvirga massiliensis TaxID=1033741 RepID=UPI00062BAE0A|nr:hypothetical protein [Microvirga massiliensis]
MGSVHHIRPRLRTTAWDGSPGHYVAEADDGVRVVGLGVQRVGRQWNWEVVNIIDETLRSGSVRTMREGRDLAEAAAAAIIAAAA